MARVNAASAVEKYIEDPIAEEILRGSIKPGANVLVKRDGEKLSFTSDESENGRAAGRERRPKVKIHEKTPGDRPGVFSAPIPTNHMKRILPLPRFL